MILLAKAKKEVGETKEPGTKRIRRSPEILMKELDVKMKRLEERIYKKNKEAVHHIGTAILKRAKFDFTNISKEDLDEIINNTPKGVELVRDIITKAHQS